MGTVVTINDTLQITKAQGFPKELDFMIHKTNPISFEIVKDKVFEFSNKETLRVYQAPPVRVFLAENIDGKWLYWGLCHVLETKLEMTTKTTSGKYKIIKIYTPQEMEQVFDLIDGRPEMNYLK